MAEQRASIRAWLEEAFNDPDKEGELTAIALVHRIGEKSKDEVHTWKLKGPNARKWTPKELADAVEKKASWRAQNLQGRQTFNILSFYGNQTDEPGAPGTGGGMFPFIVDGNPDSEGLATEGPSGTGMAMQAMRHTEVMFSQSVRQMSVLFEQMSAQMRLIGEMNRSLMKENAEAFGIVKEVLSEKSLRDHQLEMERIKATQAAELKNKIFALAPALLNTLTGKEVFPQSAADTALIEALVEGMNDLPQEKIMALADAIPPALLGPLMARINEVNAKKAKTRAEVAAIVATTPIAVEGELLDEPKKAKE